MSVSIQKQNKQLFPVFTYNWIDDGFSGSGESV